jgi:hypothetical protein
MIGGRIHDQSFLRDRGQSQAMLNWNDEMPVKDQTGRFV